MCFGWWSRNFPRPQDEKEGGDHTCLNSVDEQEKKKEACNVRPTGNRCWTNYRPPRKQNLTFGAVLSTPSGQANFISTGFRAGVVAKFVVTRTAQVVTAVAVIVLVAFDAVTIIKSVRAIRSERIRLPSIRRIHPALCGHLHHQHFACF